MKKIVAIALIAISLAGGTLIGVFLLRSKEKTPEIVQELPILTIEGLQRPIAVHIAGDEETRIKGLSGQPLLEENEGMLFLFEYPGKMAFWMKDMLFSIDIIWISSDWKVVDITPNLSPSTFPETFAPLEDAQYVLEVNAGFASRNNIKIGSLVSFKK